MDKRKPLIYILIASLGVFAVLSIVMIVGNGKNKVPQTSGTSEPIPQSFAKQKEVKYTNSKSFLEDSDFLDEYQPNIKTEEKETRKQVKLLVSSVAKDIRVTLVDKTNRKIEGVPFYVHVKDVGEYKDLDMDGSVYIGGIPEGTYEVSLKNTEDYYCNDAIEIDVSETAKCNPLDDIMFMVVQEREINVSEEDTKQADIYQDETENTKITKSNEVVTFGIDVSAWQKDIDWPKVKAAGVDFVIIRCGYRGAKTGALVEDSYFYKNLQGAKEAGIDVGVYFFTQAVTETEAVEEASMVLALVGDTELEYPIFIDSENTNGRADGLDRKTRTAVVSAFCRTIENSGRTAGIYASRDWYNTHFEDSKLDGYVRWVAEYASTTAYKRRYKMWQYTSSGSVDGITGRVDLDLSYINDRENDNG